MSLLERDSVLVSTTENGDPIVDLPFTRVNNVEGIGRSPNTTYSVGNVVYVDSNLSVALKCTTAGTTSNTELDISTKNIGDTVTDGTVVWQVCNRTSDVTSVNGKTGDVVVDVGVTSVNNKTGAVTIKESPSDMADYIIESYRNGTEWYEVYRSGKVRQGGQIAQTTSNGNGIETTVTLLKKMADTTYDVKVENYRATDLSSYSTIYGGAVLRKTGQLQVRYGGVNQAQFIDGLMWTVEGQGA